LVNFDPDLTEVIFFDLEFYVPPRDRHHNGASLMANPFRKGHFLLGGVFHRAFPLLAGGMDEPYDHLWIWQLGNEEDLLHAIFRYFQDAWALLEGKDPRQPDLMAVGIGISRFDLPVLFSRCLELGIAPRDALFSCFFKIKTVDLSEVGIPLCPLDRVPYPKSANQLGEALGLSKTKQSGRRVWDLYDASDIAAIETRTESEVRDVVQLYGTLRDRLS
jgi:hypothetical protein